MEKKIKKILPKSKKFNSRAIIDTDNIEENFQKFIKSKDKDNKK